MFKHHHKIIKTLTFSFVTLILIQNKTTGFNLSDEITSKFQDFYNNITDSIILNTYQPTFSKDPFGETMSNIEDKSIKLKIAGSKYVEKTLQEKGCNLSQKEIRSILYYFVPEFRTELVMALKKELGTYDSRKYILEEDKINNLCEKYFECEISKNSNNKSSTGITASTPENIKTNCMEFFQKKYKEGENNTRIVQNIQTAQLGSDKYINGTNDDSPFDIMIDYGVLSKLLYQDAQDPITPVFYNIPAFSNSKKSLSNNKNNNSTSTNKKSNGLGTNRNTNTPTTGIITNNGGNNRTSITPTIQNSEGANLGSNNPIKTPTPLNNSDTTYLYEELIDGLEGYSIDNNSIFYSNICENREKEVTEPEPTSSKEEKEVPNIDNRTFSELSDKEYKEIIDYMIDSVNEYSTLPETKQEEIKEKSPDTSRFTSDTTASQLKETAEEIKNCRKSCEGLRIDQKASCMLMCACGEIDSPIFNPDKTPGLGPIFTFRFCAIPAVATNFSVGGKRIHSIEEGLKEIYGVVDKLSREGRLGKWTQQYEFLDSSTKQMNVADTFAFTIDIEFVDITSDKQKHSDQYEKRKKKAQNEMRKQEYQISNPIDSPSTKNTYRLMPDAGNTALDYSSSVNPNTTRKTTEELSEDPQPQVDRIKDSNAQRYSTISEDLGQRMDQQGELRTQTSEYVQNLDTYTKGLYTKKCD